MALEQPRVNLLLIGSKGHGKSSSGNAILGRDAFQESDGTVSETLECKVEKLERDGALIRVVDTPGFIDTIQPTKETPSLIGQAMGLCPEGFNAVIFVVRYGIIFSEQERQVFDNLKQYFGENILRDFGVIVLSHGDSFFLKYNNRRTFQDWLKEQKSTDGDSPFVQLLNECNDRCVLFYNYGDKFEKLKQESVREMFDHIRRDKRYTSVDFDKATTTRETIIRKLRETEFQEKLNLLMDLLRCDMKNIDAMTHNIKEIEKDLEKLNDDSKEFHYYKGKFDGMTETYTQMKKTENDKVKQRNQQESIFNNLKCSVM